MMRPLAKLKLSTHWIMKISATRLVSQSALWAKGSLGSIVSFIIILIIIKVELYVDLKMINSTIALVHNGRAISFLDLSNPNK
jgi:hypothetical protein